MSSHNPFAALKFRYHILSAFVLINVAVLGIYIVLGYRQWLPWSLNDQLWIPLQFIATFGLLCITLWLCGRRAGLELTRVFGPAPNFSVPYGLLLTLSILIFSLSSFLLVFYPISLLAPEFVTERLTEQILAVETAFPNLYRYLMLFVVVIFAPLAEEFVFRGILLQRWAVRWSLPVGIISSSLLFGLLHINNPVGLTMFGLIMALLYVRTRSLWVPIIAHGFNNLISVAPELLVTTPQSYALEDLQKSWWIGLVGLIISLPTLVIFIRRTWPRHHEKPPYFT